MVFVALPALQRVQRDSHRKRNVQIVSSALETYKSNNRGRYPWVNKAATASDRFISFTNQERQSFFDNYVNSEKNIYDPSEGDYRFSIYAFNLGYNPTGAGGWATGFPSSYNFIRVVGAAKCSSNGGHADPAESSSSYVIHYRLEVGGLQCQQFN